jgi:hypothetical protein
MGQLGTGRLAERPPSREGSESARKSSDLDLPPALVFNGKETLMLTELGATTGA